MRLFPRLLVATLLPVVAGAQLLDDSFLSGKYYFVHLLVSVGADGQATNARNLGGGASRSTAAAATISKADWEAGTDCPMGSREREPIRCKLMLLSPSRIPSGGVLKSTDASVPARRLFWALQPKPATVLTIYLWPPRPPTVESPTPRSMESTRARASGFQTVMTAP